LGGGPQLRFGTQLAAGEVFAAGYGWGGPAGTLAVGLMPVFLLGAERVVEPARRAAGRSSAWYAAWTGLAGMVVSWFHPWQGLTLVVVVAGLLVWRRSLRRDSMLAVPLALTVAPLAYFAVLTRTHSAWGQFSHPNHFAHVGAWFWLALAPVALALPALRGKNLDTQERLLRLWPGAALLVYFTLHTSWFYQTLAGISLPLAILAVRAAAGIRLPRFAWACCALAVTIPGMVFIVDQLSRSRRDHFFAPDERRALAYLDASPRPGAVLAPQKLGQAVPGFAGRRTWVGNYQWTPGYASRRARAEDLFAGRLGAADARRLVLESRAGFVMSDCAHRVSLSATLRPMLAGVRSFGCATVYELRGSLHAHTTAASSLGTGGLSTYPAVSNVRRTSSGPASPGP
jgi:hypothetical protein